LLEARAWYDNIRPELGERFALAVEATVEALAEHPLQFPVVYRSRRRRGVRRFPYGIFFEVQDSRIVVIACFQAEIAFKVAVAKAIDEPTRLGLPVYIWRNSRVVKLSPNKTRNSSRRRK
jgi:plasmid stabilization system protein ParE